MKAFKITKRKENIKKVFCQLAKLTSLQFLWNKLKIFYKLKFTKDWTKQVKDLIMKTKLSLKTKSLLLNFMFKK